MLFPQCNLVLIDGHMPQYAVLAKCEIKVCLPSGVLGNIRVVPSFHRYTGVECNLRRHATVYRSTAHVFVKAAPVQPLRSGGPARSQDWGGEHKRVGKTFSGSEAAVPYRPVGLRLRNARGSRGLSAFSRSSHRGDRRDVRFDSGARTRR